MLKKKFTDVFQSKTQAQWCEVFDNTDACVTPVLSWEEAPDYPHNKQHGSFMKEPGGGLVPRPAPTLSRTPANDQPGPMPGPGEHTSKVLQELGYTASDITGLSQEGVIDAVTPDSKL